MEVSLGTTVGARKPQSSRNPNLPKHSLKVLEMRESLLEMRKNETLASFTHPKPIYKPFLASFCQHNSKRTTIRENLESQIQKRARERERDFLPSRHRGEGCIKTMDFTKTLAQDLDESNYTSVFMNLSVSSCCSSSHTYKNMLKIVASCRFAFFFLF